MKKVTMLSIILFLLPLTLIFSQETKSVSTEIQGIVPVVFTLSTDMTDVETIDLVNATSAYLGKVVVYTNTKALWTIVINSSNKGKLIGKTAGNDDVYPYLLGFGSIDRIDLSSEFTMTYNTLIPKTSVEYPVRVNYTKLEDLDDPVISDTYSDIVTITVTIS
jgi:hypothetical protein